MAEEKKSGGVKVMLRYLIGFILIALGVLAVIWWWQPFLMVVKACIGPVLFLVGLVFIAIAKD